MKLLLAEDEKRMAQALIEILRLENYEVDHFAGWLARRRDFLDKCWQ